MPSTTIIVPPGPLIITNKGADVSRCLLGEKGKEVDWIVNNGSSILLKPKEDPQNISDSECPFNFECMLCPQPGIDRKVLEEFITLVVRESFSGQIFITPYNVRWTTVTEPNGNETSHPIDNGWIVYVELEQDCMVIKFLDHDFENNWRFHQLGKSFL